MEKEKCNMLLDSELENALIFSVRCSLHSKTHEPYVTGYLSKILPALSDNTLWVISNEIEGLFEEGDPQEEDCCWASLKDEILKEQRKRKDELCPERVLEMNVRIDGPLPEAQQTVKKDILCEKAKFDALSLKEKAAEFKRGEEALKKMLESGVLDSSIVPFLTLTSALIDTYAEKNGYDQEDVRNFLWLRDSEEEGEEEVKYTLQDAQTQYDPNKDWGNTDKDEETPA